MKTETDKQARYQKLVAEIRELRRNRDQADAKLLLRLVRAERDDLDVVLDSGCESFARFVAPIVSPGRYDAFKLGLAKVGQSEALAIGSDATIVAGQATEENKDKYTEACQAWVSEHNGTVPNRQTAKHLLMQVDPRKETPKAVQDIERRADELARLRAENAELRAKLRTAEQEIVKLRRASSSGRAARAQAGAQPHARGRKEKPKG